MKIKDIEKRNFQEGENKKARREREKRKKIFKRGRRLKRLFLTLMELFLQLPDCYVRMFGAII